MKGSSGELFLLKHCYYCRLSSIAECEVARRDTSLPRWPFISLRAASEERVPSAYWACNRGSAQTWTAVTDLEEPAATAKARWTREVVSHPCDFGPPHHYLDSRWIVEEPSPCRLASSGTWKACHHSSTFHCQKSHSLHYFLSALTLVATFALGTISSCSAKRRSWFDCKRAGKVGSVSPPLPAQPTSYSTPAQLDREP